MDLEQTETEWHEAPSLAGFGRKTGPHNILDFAKGESQLRAFETKSGLLFFEVFETLVVPLSTVSSLNPLTFAHPVEPNLCRKKCRTSTWLLDCITRCAFFFCLMLCLAHQRGHTRTHFVKGSERSSSNSFVGGAENRVLRRCLAMASTGGGKGSELLSRALSL